MRLPPYRGPWPSTRRIKTAAAVAPPTPIVFRKTLSSFGSGGGKRQTQNS